MAVTQKELSQISEYIKSQFSEWMENLPVRQTRRDFEFDLHERIIRVEEELKSQRELMKQGFEHVEKRIEQVDKRIEQIDKRFEQVDKRFEQVDKRFESFESRFNRITAVITVGFITMAALISAYQFLG